MLINKSTQNDNNQGLKRMERESLPRRRHALLPHERLGKRPSYADYAKRGWEGDREEESRKKGERGGRWRIFVVRATLKNKDHRILGWYLETKFTWISLSSVLEITCSWCFVNQRTWAIFSAKIYEIGNQIWHHNCSTKLLFICFCVYLIK